MPRSFIVRSSQISRCSALVVALGLGFRAALDIAELLGLSLSARRERQHVEDNFRLLVRARRCLLWARYARALLDYFWAFAGSSIHRMITTRGQ
eukprot:scaffold36276_cov170-Isochrysis_galbana.AAC.1